MARKGGTTGRIDGRARIAAWLGVVALLVQALLPAAAMAAQSGAPQGERIIVCTLTGVKAVTLGGHGKGDDGKGDRGFAGLPCHDCLAATTAALPAPEPELRRISYATAFVEHGPERSWAPQLARAPPRPPGQGPPTSLNVTP